MAGGAETLLCSDLLPLLEVLKDVRSIWALFGRLKSTVRRHKFNEESLPSLRWWQAGRIPSPAATSCL